MQVRLPKQGYKILRMTDLRPVRVESVAVHHDFALPPSPLGPLSPVLQPGVRLPHREEPRLCVDQQRQVCQDVQARHQGERCEIIWHSHYCFIKCSDWLFFQSLDSACSACTESRIRTDNSYILVSLNDAIKSFMEMVSECTPPQTAWFQSFTLFRERKGIAR